MNTNEDFTTDTAPEEPAFTVEQIRDNQTTEAEIQQVENELGDEWPRIIALALSLGITYEDAREQIQEGYDEKSWEYGNEEYLVVTDDEADELWDEDLQNYIDACVLPEIPEQYRNYFNQESFKDNCKYDGRAHSLSRYDGKEDEQTVNNTTYYIYRQN